MSDEETRPPESAPAVEPPAESPKIVIARSEYNYLLAKSAAFNALAEAFAAAATDLARADAKRE